ncbi:response regulator (plasmid) [Streptomyces rochei]|uniref:response regulator n=1 Tax=Streptomyces TaxID=1883 RepID=UPI0004C65F27|nr:response regulator transcription factor [Streptomyces sp. WAC05458]RSS15330.1 DNA-binding response regulator [Streptomyces sp. WAC05458]
MIQVAVVDDEALVRAALRQILDSAEDIEVVADCDGGDALRQVRMTRPDLVLVDGVMPGVDGVQVVRAVRTLPEPPAVAMLTAFDSGELFADALRSGVAGFLVKDADPDTLIDAVRVLAAGGSVLNPHVRHTFADVLRPQETAMPSRAATVLPRLTERERQVLSLVATGMSNAEIAACLGIGAATVKDHVRSLRLKLGARTRVAVAVAAYQMGLDALPGRSCAAS